jgi:hypothetical protein
MKQFQKIGVAAAVASVAAGAVAQSVSRTETGDLAIVPYYTVKDGVNTGLHIINTTESTQVVKVRLRRGTDSKDALDFNLVMSPRDEWTANIGASGDEKRPVLLTTNDTTCTVPAFPEGGALMPKTFGDGAEEGYIEVIAMAQTPDETNHLSVGAKHADGVPANCLLVEQHFYRVALEDDEGNVQIEDETVRGVHTSRLVGSGVCTEAEKGVLPGTDTAVALTAFCPDGTSNNLTEMEDSDDNALKVSFMLTDPNGGLEAGDNAVMVEGFAGAPMMTNQQPLSFGIDGILKFDPLNFELPNLGFGSYTSSDDTRKAHAVTAIRDGSMMAGLMEALDADSIMNDWAAFDTADGTVNADWVVTLPGQYVMVNPVCEAYGAYNYSSSTAVAACATAATTAWSGATANDRNQLPLTVASNYKGESLIEESNLSLWDREEFQIVGKDKVPSPDDPTLGLSPGGSEGTPPGEKNPVYLKNEVNVIDFGEEGADSALVSELKLTVSPDGYDRGWASLAIEPDAPEGGIAAWQLTGVDDDDITAGYGKGGFTAAGAADLNEDHVAVVGFAVWQRSFAAQAGNNYGRMVEHSTVSSSR